MLERLPARARELLTSLDRGAGKTFHTLALLGGELPAPYGIDELLELLRTDPARSWRLIFEQVTWQQDGELAPLAEALAAGDDAAAARLRALGADAECPAGFESLLEHTPDAHGRAVLEVLELVRAAVWDDLAPEAMGAIERDVAHRQQQLAEDVPLEQVVLEATNGYELDVGPTSRRVVLLPSYWMRPWLDVGTVGDAEVLTTVVADEFVQLPKEAPPPALLKLFKALGDEGRLRLLRRMSCGPISLGEATEELGVAKATAHHHMSILRQAGLVSIREEGRSMRYGLRTDPPAAARDALAAYVPPRC